MKRASLVAAIVLIASVAGRTARQDLPEGPGKDEVARLCAGCHDLMFTVSTRETEEDWTRIVNDMRSRGVDGTEEEFARVIAYLTAHMGKGKAESPAGVAAGTVAAAQQGGAIDQFRTSDRYAKARIITEAVTGKRPATETDVRELLLAGMTDPDTFVREHAVGMIASILQLSSMPGVPPEFQWGIARRPVAQALWPELNAAADDSEARVRSEAIRGIAVVFAHGNPIFRSASELSARLVAKLDTDPLPGIRSLAVSALGSAHRSYDPAIRDLALRVVLKALDDADPFIVQAAAHGAAEFTPPQALPLLAKQLQHPSHVARMAVGQVIAAYRERARAYVPALEAALAVETDDITRKTILGTLSIIR